MSVEFSPWFLLIAVTVSSLHVSFGHEDDEFFNVHDKQHINEHMAESKMKNDGHMSNEDMEFNYFKMHDFNNDDKLDGLEIAKSLMDHQKADHDAPTVPDYKIEQVVNKVLANEDLNKDGYVDYSEFVIAQKNLNSKKNSQHL